MWCAMSDPHNNASAEFSDIQEILDLKTDNQYATLSTIVASTFKLEFLSFQFVSFFFSPFFSTPEHPLWNPSTLSP